MPEDDDGVANAAGSLSAGGDGLLCGATEVEDEAAKVDD